MSRYCDPLDGALKAGGRWGGAWNGCFANGGGKMHPLVDWPAVIGYCRDATREYDAHVAGEEPSWCRIALLPGIGRAIEPRARHDSMMVLSR